MGETTAQKVEETAGSSPAQRLPVVLGILMVIAATAVLVCFGGIAVSHLNDTYKVDHVAGVWIGLAYHLNNGTLYPPLYDGEHYAGSRYMPLYFAAHAALAQVTGEYVMSGKLLSLASMAACLILVFLVLRWIGCPFSVALALVSLVPASTSGSFGGTTIRGDLLAVVWQVAALAVIDRKISTGSTILAAALCTLGILTKMSALWAPAAIFFLLLVRDRKALVVFTSACLIFLGLSMGLIQWLSSGNLLEGMRAFREPGWTSFLLFLKSPFRLLRYLTTAGPFFPVFLAFAIIELFSAWTRGRLTVFHLAWVLCIPVLLVVYTDRGTVYNHLIDLVVLTVLLIGSLWSAQGVWRRGQVGLQWTLAVAILWGQCSLWAANLSFPSRSVLLAAMGNAEGDFRRPPKPLAELIPDDAKLLTEHPLVDVARGQAPVVLDPYLLPYMKQLHPEWIDNLAGRIKRHEFQFIVLQYRLDLDPNVNDNWYRIIFGDEIATVIRSHYRFWKESDGFTVLTPAG